jgi:Uncharacterized protein related to arylsulfate sulfotransferase involved in siderophore biosynthesis
VTAFTATVRLVDGKAVEMQGRTRRAADGTACLDLEFMRIDQQRRRTFAGAATIALGAAEDAFAAARALDKAGVTLPVEPARSINVRINGRRTTVKLEALFADGLQEIANAQGIELDELLSQIERANDSAGQPYNLASAARVYVLRWFFEKARRDGGGGLDS